MSIFYMKKLFLECGKKTVVITKKVGLLPAGKLELTLQFAATLAVSRARLVRHQTMKQNRSCPSQAVIPLNVGQMSWTLKATRCFKTQPSSNAVDLGMKFYYQFVLFPLVSMDAE